MIFYLKEELTLPEAKNKALKPGYYKHYNPKYILDRVCVVWVTVALVRENFYDDASPKKQVVYARNEYKRGNEIEARGDACVLTLFSPGIWISIPKALCRIDKVIDGRYNL